MGCETKMLLQNAVSHETSASCMSDADILAEVMRPDSIEDEDDDDDNDNDLNDNIDDLNCPPPLTRPSKRDIEEAMDKL